MMEQKMQEQIEGAIHDEIIFHTQPPPKDNLTIIEEWANINYLNIEDQAGDKHECIERDELINFIKTLKTK